MNDLIESIAAPGRPIPLDILPAQRLLVERERMMREVETVETGDHVAMFREGAFFPRLGVVLSNTGNEIAIATRADQSNQGRIIFTRQEDGVSYENDPSVSTVTDDDLPKLKDYLDTGQERHDAHFDWATRGAALSLPAPA